MSSASHRKTKRIEAETALELLELLFIKTVGRPGDPLRDGLQKGEARFSQAGLLQFKAKWGGDIRRTCVHRLLD